MDGFVALLSDGIGRGDALEEVRVDVGQRHRADALDLYNNVLVAADAARVALVALERPGDDADAVPLADVVLAVDLAPVGALRGQKPDERYLGVGDGLNARTRYVAVDAERRKAVGRVLAPLLKGEGLGLGGLYEHELGNHGAHRVGASVGMPDCLLWEVDRTAQRAEAAFGLEHPGRFYGVPMCGIVHPRLPEPAGRV